MIDNYKSAWFELKSRLENHKDHLELRVPAEDHMRINDTKAIIKKMDQFEEEIKRWEKE
ncbi:hypothetical protein [Bacillus sp. Hm123]|uniref:hypothetical protein n=1 Tax=Bacillus sp. Hm123 TaxID=3450745 RepID=UPI003F44188F